MKKIKYFIFKHMHAIALLICSFTLLWLIQQKPLKYYGLWILWLIQVIVLFRNINTFGKKRKGVFADYDDKTNRPIKVRAYDEYNVANLIDLIKARIKLINHCKTSYILGINGAWGIGKTSIINIVETELSKISKDYIFIHFNPWHWSGATPETLVKALKEAFAEGNDANADISEYFDKIIEIYEKETIYTKLLSLLKKRDTFENIKENIKTNIKNKYIIIVDDLDRCTDEELSCVFNLLREFLNWPNIIVVLCYDKTRIQASNIELEKLIDNEVTIHIEKSEIRETFIKKLSEINPLTEVEQSELLKCTTWVDTPRKIKSVLIDVQALWDGLKDKLYFPHFVSITVLNKENKYIYEIFANNLEIFNDIPFSKKEQFNNILVRTDDDINTVIKYFKYLTANTLIYKDGTWEISTSNRENNFISRFLQEPDVKGIWNNHVTESYFIYRYAKNIFNDYELEDLKNIITSKVGNSESKIHRIIDNVYTEGKINSFIDQIRYGIPKGGNDINTLIIAICSYGNNISTIDLYRHLFYIINENIDNIDLGIECIKRTNHIYLTKDIYNLLILKNKRVFLGGDLNKEKEIKEAFQKRLTNLLIEGDKTFYSYGIKLNESIEYFTYLESSEKIIEYMNKLLTVGSDYEIEHQYDILIKRTDTDFIKDAIPLLIVENYVDKINDQRKQTKLKEI